MLSQVLLFTVFVYSTAEPQSFGYTFSVSPPYNFPYLNYHQSPQYVPPAIRSAPYNIPAPVVPFYAPTFKQQYHHQDLLGQASYGHTEPGQSHTAIQDALGNKIGSFSYYNAEGKLVQTNYIADAAGYRVSSNDLPTAPIHTAVLPVPPQDTPEVAAAKATHLAEVEKAKGQIRRDAPVSPGFFERSYNPVNPPIVSNNIPVQRIPFQHAYTTTNNLPVVTPDGFLQDTPEVNAAKANHFNEFAAALRRNNAQPQYQYNI